MKQSTPRPSKREQHLLAETLAEVTLALTSQTDHSAVLDEILRQTKRIVPYASANIMLLEGNNLRIVRWQGYESFGIESLVSNLVQPLDNLPIDLEAVRSRKPIIISDAHQDPRWVVLDETSWIRAYMTVPICLHDRVLGLLRLDSDSPSEFSAEDANRLQPLVNAAAIALENARLFTATRRQAEQLEALRQVGLELAAELDRDALLHSITSRAIELLDGTGGRLYLYRPDREILEPVVSIGPHSPPIGSVLRRGEGLSGKVWETGEPLIVDNYQTWEGRAAAYEDAMPLGIVGVAIQWGEEFLGVLNVSVQTDPPRTFSPVSAELLGLFATQAAIAIRNARLFADAQEYARRMHALYETNRALSSSLEEEPVMRAILEAVYQILGCEHVIVSTVDEEAKTIGIRHGIWRGEFDVFPEWIQMSQYSLDHPDILTDIYRTGRTEIIGEWDERLNRDIWDRFDHERYLRVFMPLKMGDRVIGIVEVGYDKHVKSRIDDEEVQILAAFMDQAAVALENARLYRQLRDYAGQLEQRVQERTAQLQAQYARVDAILRSTSDGIIVTDKQGDIVQTNLVAQAWLTQTLSPEDAAGLREAVRDLAQQAITKAAAGERPEMVLELAGLDLELRAAPILEPEMRETATVVVVHDVSHLKAVDRMKSRFITSISHELRTPVTTIKALVDAIQRTPQQQEEKWKKYVDMMVQEADHQARIVQDVLRISRIDGLAIRPRPTPLNELTNVTVLSHQTLAKNQNLALTHRPAEPGPTALADPEQMMHVLNNLVENAIHYTPAGGKVVVTTGQDELKERRWATVTVTDTGMGIPEDELPHVFDRFFRGEEPKSLQISGTGLGLAIAKEIVDLHAGRLTVKSEAGSGSSFTVWLPLADS
jgi:signal transduction histidine kinase/putative methionine-R-sulfoxide reductase with GAF domain